MRSVPFLFPDRLLLPLSGQMPAALYHCPSIAAGTGTPSHGGFLYYEVLEIVQGLAKQNNIVGIDLVEVAPAYDPSESTQILAAQLLLNLIGFIFHNRQA